MRPTTKPGDKLPMLPAACHLPEKKCTATVPKKPATTQPCNIKTCKQSPIENVITIMLENRRCVHPWSVRKGHIYVLMLVRQGSLVAETKTDGQTDQ